MNVKIRLSWLSGRMLKSGYGGFLEARYDQVTVACLKARNWPVSDLLRTVHYQEKLGEPYSKLSLLPGAPRKKMDRLLAPL